MFTCFGNLFSQKCLGRYPPPWDHRQFLSESQHLFRVIGIATGYSGQPKTHQTTNNKETITNTNRFLENAHSTKIPKNLHIACIPRFDNKKCSTMIFSIFSLSPFYCIVLCHVLVGDISFKKIWFTLLLVVMWSQRWANRDVHCS